MKPQVPSDFYFVDSYDLKERFISYWHQINEVIQTGAKHILEIGKGNGLVTNYLRERGINVLSLDIDFHLNPDVVGNILAIPFVKESFEVVTCYEVLEHLPYEKFAEALKELLMVSKKYVILSLPDVTTIYRINIELPRMKPIKKLIPHPFPRPGIHKFDGQHYWEIGKKYYPLKRILNDIAQSGFNILKTYRIFEFYYQRIVLLERC